MRAFKRILVATDFSEHADAAVDAAADLAIALDAELVVVHAYEPPSAVYPASPFMPLVDLQPSLQRAALAGIDATVDGLRTRLERVSGIIRCGTPWREIVDAAKTVGADLLVCGTHGRTGFAHALLGSVAEKVVRTSPVPVLTIHAPAAKAAQSTDATTSAAHSS